MQMLWDNKLLNATLARSTEAPRYPVESLQDTRLSRVFRTADVSDEYVKIETEITASRLAILAHNLTSGATITLQGNNTDSWTTPAFSHTCTWKEDIILEKFTQATYSYWRLYIHDPANTDGYIELGGLFLGTYLQLPNMSIDQEIPDVTTSEASESATGQTYGDEGYIYRNPKINFPSITHTQRGNIRTMWRSVKNVTPVITVIWANREDIETPIYGRIDQDDLVFKRTENPVAPFSTSIKIKEVF